MVPQVRGVCLNRYLQITLFAATHSFRHCLVSTPRQRAKLIDLACGEMLRDYPITKFDYLWRGSKSDGTRRIH